MRRVIRGGFIVGRLILGVFCLFVYFRSVFLGLIFLLSYIFT